MQIFATFFSNADAARGALLVLFLIACTWILFAYKKRYVVIFDEPAVRLILSEQLKLSVAEALNAQSNQQASLARSIEHMVAAIEKLELAIERQQLGLVQVVGRIAEKRAGS